MKLLRYKYKSLDSIYDGMIVRFEDSVIAKNQGEGVMVKVPDNHLFNTKYVGNVRHWYNLDDPNQWEQSNSTPTITI